MPETAHELVARGAALLDEKLPGWADVIDLERLDMAHGCHCVLGQIGTEVFNLDSSWDYRGRNVDPYSPYIRTSRRFLGDADTHSFGFDEPEAGEGDVSYDDLQDAWKGEIVARRTLGDTDA